MTEGLQVRHQPHQLQVSEVNGPMLIEDVIDTLLSSQNKPTLRVQLSVGVLGPEAMFLTALEN